MIKHRDSHIDHGLSDAQLAYVLERFAARMGFFIEEIELPEDLGTVPCGLYGPCMGDARIEANEVSYERRGDRAWTSRIVDRPTRPTRTLTVIAGPHEEKCQRCDGHGVIGQWKAQAPCGCTDGRIMFDCVLYTAFGGSSAPPEPGDPSCKDSARSAAFWAVHALARDVRSSG